MIQYKGVNHLAMVTGDMDRTIRFWRDLLQMRMVVGLGKAGYRHYFFEINETDMIAFFEWPGVEPVPERDHGYPVTGPFIFDHVSFGVENEQDLWVLKDRLSAADFWTSEVIDHGFIHSLYSFDPNGIPIEFSYAVPGVDVRKRPKMFDPAPTETAGEGPEPQVDRCPAVDTPTPPEEWKVYPGVASELFRDGEE